eukprot:gene18239-37073_t
MTYDQFKEIYKKDKKNEDDIKKDDKNEDNIKKDKKNEDDIKKDYTKLKSYCSNVIFNKGVNKREYKYSTDTPANIGGRLYSGGSIQGLPKKIRGFLMKHTTDIDMKNAHPVILQFLCLKY